MFKKVSCIVVFLIALPCAYAEGVFIDNGSNYQRSSDEMQNKVELFIATIESWINGVGEERFHSALPAQMEIISDDFLRETRPSSLGIPSVNWMQFRELSKGLFKSTFDSYALVADKITVSDNKVFVEAHADAVVNESRGGGKYEQQYLLIFEFNKKGQISKLIEYVDSYYTSCFFGFIDCVGTPSSSKISAAISITSSWAKGYCAQLSIENISHSSIEDWQVKLNLKNASIDTYWNGTATVSGSYLTVSNPIYKGEILPGSSIDFNYCANIDGTDWFPEIRYISP